MPRPYLRSHPPKPRREATLTACICEPEPPLSPPQPSSGEAVVLPAVAVAAAAGAAAAAAGRSVAMHRLFAFVDRRDAAMSPSSPSSWATSSTPPAPPTAPASSTSSPRVAIRFIYVAVASGVAWFLRIMLDGDWGKTGSTDPWALPRGYT
ncbi:hypothetical protein ACP4OV_023872 [Aristida adscensionis]